MSAVVERTVWTEDADDMLRSLIASGMTCGEAADAIGLSKGAVQTRMSRLGVRTVRVGKIKMEPAVREAIIYRHCQSWRPSRIARQVHETVAVVTAVIAEYEAHLAARAKPVARKRRPVKPVISPVVKAEPPAECLPSMPPRIRDVLTAIADRHDLDPRLITSATRKKLVTIARCEAAFEMRSLGLSYPQIGRYLRRDHSTMIHAVARFEELKSSGAAA